MTDWKILFAGGLLAACLSGCAKKDMLERPEAAVAPIPVDAEVADFPVGEFGATMIETTVGDIATLNPLVSEDASSSDVIARILDTLITTDPYTGVVIPNLAKSWDISDDNLVYTFHLREGVHWSDGHPFTADDVIFTWNCIFAKKRDPDTGELMLDEEGKPVYRYNSRITFQMQVNGQEPTFEKIDDHTVRFTTPEVYAPFLEFGGLRAILPKHVLETNFKDGTLLDQWSLDTAINEPWKIVGLDMYVVESYRPGERIVLAANPNYWKVNPDGARLPYIERIITKIVPDVNSSNVAFAQGLTDFEQISTANMAWVKRGEESHDYTILDMGPEGGSSSIWFNMKPGSNAEGIPYVAPHKFSWFTNKFFRQAISYGINREGIIKGVFFGRANVLHGFVSEKNTFWVNNDIRKYPYSPERSRELFAGIGFKYRNGKLFDSASNPVEFTILTNVGSGTRGETATVFKENMAALGIQVELQFLDFNTLVNKISGSFDYESCLLGLSEGSLDPSLSKDILMSSGRLHFWNQEQKEPATEWEARIDELMLEIGRNLDVEKRKAAYFEVQAILAEQQPALFLVTPTVYWGHRNRWQNLEPTELDGVLWNLESIWAEVDE